MSKRAGIKCVHRPTCVQVPFSASPTERSCFHCSPSFVSSARLSGRSLSDRPTCEPPLPPEPQLKPGQPQKYSPPFLWRGKKKHKTDKLPFKMHKPEQNGAFSRALKKREACTIHWAQRWYCDCAQRGFPRGACARWGFTSNKENGHVIMIIPVPLLIDKSEIGSPSFFDWFPFSLILFLYVVIYQQDYQQSHISLKCRSLCFINLTLTSHFTWNGTV